MGIGNIADTGMQAAMSNMEVISNNIANANTIGYKSSTINFADIYPSANGSSGSQIGLGVNVANITQNFGTGGFLITQEPLDLGINQSGFFVLKDPISGQTTFSRAGRFSLSSDGYIVYGGRNTRMQGFAAVNGVIPQGSSLSDIKINNSTLPAKASTSIAINLNLQSNSPTLTVAGFVPTDPNTYSFQSSSNVFDSLGNSHTVNAYYIKTGSNAWATEVYVDNTSVGSGTVSFNTDGTLAGTTGMGALSFAPGTGATSPQTFAMNLANSTQNSTNSVVNSTTNDGYTAGNFSNITIDGNGVVTMNYTNNQALAAGQIALANFIAPQGLSSVGDMQWMSTSSSGDPIINQALSISNITTGALEQSNVDLTSEMVNLINAQHTFQANAQVEQTYSEVMQTVIQI